MRIDSLDLIRYGHFSGREISFASVKPDFHVIYGENEAGKSTLLRAISSLLFGVPPRTPDVHTYKGSELRIGGTISQPNQPFSFRRRKGVTGTLLDLTDGQIPDACLEPFLRELDRERFEQFFGLDHKRLRDGGEELLRGKGDVGSALFQASGLLDLTKLLAHLNDEAKDLFSPKSKGKVVGLALDEYKQAVAETKRLAISASEVKEKEAQLQAAINKHEELRAQSHTLHQQQIRLRRIASNKPDIASLQKLRGSLGELHSNPALPPDSRRRRDDATAALAEADHQIHRLVQQIADRKQRIQALPLGQLYKAHGAEIEVVNAAIHDYVRGISDRPKRERDRDDAIHRAELEWREVNAWRKRPVADAELIRDAYARKAEIRELLTSHARLASQFDQADEQARTAKVDHRRLTKQLELSAEPADPGALLAAVESAKSLGDVEGATNRLRSECKRLSSEMERELKQFAFVSEIEQLAGLKTPLLSTIERYAREWENLEEKRKELESRKAALEDTIRKTEAELQTSGKEIGGYAETDLHEERSLRDALLKLLEAVYIGKVTANEAQRKSESLEPLPENFRHHLRRSDEIADLRFVHASATAIHDRLLKELSSARAQLLAAEQEIAALEEDAATFQKRWKKQWVSLGCAPLSPLEMKEWMQLRQGILNQLEQTQEKQIELQNIEMRAAAASHGICDQLKAVRPDVKPGKESLSVLIKLAEGITKEIQAERNSIRDLRREIELLDLDARQVRLSECKAGLSQWASLWGPHMRDLLLPETTTPEETGEALDALERVFGHLDKANDLQHRVKRIGDNISEFEEKVSRLVSALDSALSAASPDSAAAELHSRFVAMGRAETKRAEMESQNESDELVLAEYHAKAHAASITLESLKRSASCKEDAALEKIIRAAEERAEKQAEYDRITRSLIERNGVSDVEQVEKEAAGVELDALQSEIAAGDERLQSLQNEALAAGIDAGRLGDSLRRLQNSEESSLQAQKAEDALAKARPAIAQYLRLRIASELLQQAIEAYRQKHQGPVLTRASELFSQLTVGDHSGLTTSFGDDDKPILVAIRKNKEQVDVSGLSDGTRDQLYLALRLARIEQHIASVSACPVILDDILINLDDIRASAALKVFAALGERTQVLLFTHHTRIVELAMQAGAQRIDLESAAAAVA